MNSKALQRGISLVFASKFGKWKWKTAAVKMSNSHQLSTTFSFCLNVRIVRDSAVVVSFPLAYYKNVSAEQTTTRI